MNSNQRARLRQYFSMRALLPVSACLVGIGSVYPAGIMAAVPADASSTNADGDAIGEIVVTAQKRAENLQNVPIAITAVTEADLDAGGVHDVTNLNNVVPALNYTTAIGIYGQPVIRSVGTSSHGPGIENPVATYVDGVYLASATSALLSLADVSQVDVLKGPQGTLFGRNATGGLIQVTTKAPTQDLNGAATVTLGNVGTFDQMLFINGGITDSLSANLAASHEKQTEGFGRNLYNGMYVGTFEDTSVRGKLRWQPGDSTDITLSLDYSKHTGADPAIRTLTPIASFSGPPYYMAGGPFDVNLDGQPTLSYEGAGASLTAKQDFQGAQLVSITAYRDAKATNYFDADSSVDPILAIGSVQKDWQFSEEVQLLSTGNRQFNWMTGLYFMSADGKSDPSTTYLSFAPGPSTLSADSKLTSYAVFGQVTYTIDPATNLTGGLRYTSDKRHLTSSQLQYFPDGSSVPGGPPVDASKTFAQPSWRLSLDHRFSPELMGYVSYNRGFRSGTFVSDLAPTVELKPETLNAYEVGLKSDLFDKRVRADVAAYFYDYHNRQVLTIANGQEVVYDAKAARSYGLDADLTAKIVGGLSLTAGASVIHSTYTDFKNAVITTLDPAGGEIFTSGDATGNSVENTPRFTINIGPTYQVSGSAGEFTASVNYYHNSGWYGGPDNRARQPAYDTVAASVKWVPLFFSHMSVELWGRNLGNTAYATQLQETNFGDNRSPGAGRTFGVTLGVRF